LGTPFAKWASEFRLFPGTGKYYSNITGTIAPREEKHRMAKTATAPKQKLKVVPLGDRVVLKRAEAETRTTGGIVLPDTARDKPQRGEVIAVGDGHIDKTGRRIPLTVKPGDRVIFSSYAGDEINVGDDEYLLLRESDILATF
jgi:chaperonin GroES